MKFIILIGSILMILCHHSFSQNTLSISPQFHQNKIQIDSTYYVGESISPVKITRLKFYLSNISLWDNHKKVYDFPNQYYLVDLKDSNSLSIAFNISKSLFYQTIKFNVGIDSISHTEGVKGGALDPTNGMYWTWQSGYIYFKLEGVSSLCPTRKNKFQFHIGGYQYPFNAIIPIQLPVNTKKNLSVNIDLENILTNIDLQKNHTIMQPSNAAKEMGELIKTSTHITTK